MLQIIKELILHSNPKSPVSEAYRVLRTNIQYSFVDKPLKSVVVTSSGPGEGKTTTVTNMAIAFAQSGSKVLLVDGDLRKPRIHKVFGIASGKGLSNLLISKGGFGEYVNQTEVPNLYVLPCGTIPPNPSEILSSNAMRQFMEEACFQYDMVFVDAPPVGAVTDAAILSTICDGVVIVAASGVVEDYALVRAKELLTNVNANIIGVVLNRIKKSSSASYHYYYYYYYDTNEKESGENSTGTRHKERRRKKKNSRANIEVEA